MRGRKPKPTQIHVLNGNPSKLDLVKRKASEPKPEIGMPSCPSWLDGIGRSEWNRVCPELAKMGLMTKVDRTALAGYCASYSRWVRAEKAILSKEAENNGLTYKSRSKRVALPEVKIAQDALTQVKMFCVEFGLTPSSRARMAIPGKKEDATTDPIEAAIDAANKKACQVLPK